MTALQETLATTHGCIERSILLFGTTTWSFYYTQRKTTFWLIQSEFDIRTRIANARIPDIETLAALLIPHPLDLGRPTPILQLRQRTKEDPNGVTTADRVLRPDKVF